MLNSGVLGLSTGWAFTMEREKKKEDAGVLHGKSRLIGLTRSKLPITIIVSGAIAEDRLKMSDIHFRANGGEIC
jgi:hypothetical protein